MFRREKDLDKFKVCLIDLLCVICSCFFTYQLPYNDLSQNSAVFIGILHILVFYLGNEYYHFYRRGYLEELKAVIIYELEMIIAMMVITFITRGQFNISRRGVTYYCLISSVLIYTCHSVIKLYRHKVYPESMASKKVYLVTTKDRLPLIFKRMEYYGAWGGKIVAIALFDDEKRTIKEYKGIPVVANQDNYISFAQYEVVDDVLVNLPPQFKLDIEVIVSQFEEMGARVSFSINAFDLDIACEKRITKLAGFSVVTFSSNFYSNGQVFIKRLIDICGAVIGLICTCIISIILVPLIKLESKGPAIFVQERVGKNGRIFKFYKFRSMYPDAEERKAELMAQNEMEGLMFKMENDPRITKIGRFIRKTSLDELPQFYNVLRGDMSLVGTRPPTVDEYRQYEAHHKRRLSAKPGITGMWQVSGRSDITDFDDVIRLDSEYIDNWSVWMDIKILLKTIKVIVFGNGAR